jgi:uncharacterized membrane protein
MAGLAIDSGNLTTARRALQGTTDLAAISAASNLQAATSGATQTATYNGYLPSDVQSVVTGIYTPDPTLPPAQRFQPAAPAASNAAQVTMQHPQPLYFSDLFNLASGKPTFAPTALLTTTAIATAQRTAAFDIGSGVASFNGGVINDLLGATIGSGASLSLIGYNALAGAQINLFGFAQALAVQLGQVGRTPTTYGQVFSGSLPLAAYLTALQQADPAIAPELQPLVNAATASAATVDLGPLLDTGPYAQQSLTAPLPNISATASALTLVQSAIQLGGAPHLISYALNANIPGIAAATVSMTIGEPPQGSTLMAVDQQGSSVHTSQIRLFLNLTLSADVAAASVTVPLYIEVGYGTASLSSLACVPLDNTATTASLAVQPGLVNAWIGNVTSAAMLNYTAEPTPTDATLLTLLGLATVTGRANAMVGNTSPVPVTYSGSDIQNIVVKTTTTSSFAGSLTTTLLNNLSLKVNVLNAALPIPPGLTAGVSSALSAAAPAIDTAITDVLTSLGAGVGTASTWITGAHCGAATLSG